jgi:hypothetical protein
MIGHGFFFTPKFERMITMGFFDKILEKLGLRKKDQAAGTGTAKPEFGSAGGGKTPSAGGQQGGSAPTAISEVDVVKQLEKRAEGSGLNWKVSIVDLLKVLDIDSSREARNELAKELGCPPELMNDSAKMNTWLHKAVLKKIAQNGGNIPPSLLD